MKALLLLAFCLHVAFGASLQGAETVDEAAVGDGETEGYGDGIAGDGESVEDVTADDILDMGRAAIYGHFDHYAAGSRGQKAKERDEEDAARARDEEYGFPPHGHPPPHSHPPPGYPEPPHSHPHPGYPEPPHGHPHPGYPEPPHPGYPEPPPGYPPHGYPPHPPPGWPKQPPPGWPPYPPQEEEHTHGWPEPPLGYPHHPPPGWPPYPPHEEEEEEELEDEFDYHRYPPHHHHHPHHHPHYPPHYPPYPPPPKPKACPKVCDLSAYPDCSCLHPATFTKDGRGNCNVGALKPDLQVWCYVDPDNGDPKEVCPDAEKSSSKKGYYWSRFACITE